MTYYALSHLKDGKPPGFRAIGAAEDALPGEVVVQEPPGPDEVWDEAAGSLREPTPDEALELKKAQKVAQMDAAALNELAPLFTDGAGEKELAFVLAPHVRRIMGNQADPRLAVVEEVGAKALTKRDQIAAAQSPGDLEDIEWT